jgi:O-antigen ligase
MKKLTVQMVLSLIFVTPLFFLPFTNEYFESPKAYLLIFGGFLIFLISLVAFKDFLGYLVKIANSMLWQLMIGFLLVQSITSYFGFSLPISIWGSQNQKNGLLFLYALTLFAIVLSYLFATKQLSRRIVFQTILYSAVFVSLVGIFKFFLHKSGLITFDGLFFDSREVSTFGQPNFFGFYVGVAVLLIPYASSFYKRVLLYGALLVAEVLTASKSGWIIFCLNSIVLLIQNKNYNVNKKYIGYFVVTFLIFLNIGLLFSKTKNYETFINSDNSYQYRRLTAVYSNPTTAEQDRITILKLSIEAAQKRILIGYGKGHIDSALYESIQSTSLKEKGIVDSSHNLFLDTVLEGGLFSLIILVVIFGLLFKDALVACDYTKTFLLVAIVINGMIHNTSNVVYFLLFVLVGMYGVKEVAETANSS